MRVSFERTGGFAGGALRWEADLDKLPADEARELRALLDQAAFFDLSATNRAPAGAADHFTYRIDVEHDGRRHRVVTTDAGMPDGLKGVVKNLTNHAKVQRRPAQASDPTRP